MDIQKIQNEFDDLLDDISREYNPENGKNINFEDLFEYDILGNHPELEDYEHEKAMNWFYENLENIETNFWKSVDTNIKEAKAWEDTKEYLNMTFGVY